MGFNPFTLRALPLYFLMPSPPDKSGIFESKVFVCINPFVLWTLPYVYSETPHNDTGHGKEEREMHHSVPVIEGIHTSPLCFAQQNIGEKQRSDSDDERG